jgi:hypothetical protein
MVKSIGVTHQNRITGRRKLHLYFFPISVTGSLEITPPATHVLVLCPPGTHRRIGFRRLHRKSTRRPGPLAPLASSAPATGDPWRIGLRSSPLSRSLALTSLVLPLSIGLSLSLSLCISFSPNLLISPLPDLSRLSPCLGLKERRRTE